jgi:hypothetical protein
VERIHWAQAVLELIEPPPARTNSEASGAVVMRGPSRRFGAPAAFKRRCSSASAMDRADLINRPHEGRAMNDWKLPWEGGCCAAGYVSE